MLRNARWFLWVCVVLGALAGSGGAQEHPRRVEIVFEPEPGSEVRYDCAVTGRIKVPTVGTIDIGMDAVFVRQATDRRGENGAVVAMSIPEGDCLVDEMTIDISGMPTLYIETDERCLIHRVDREEGFEPETDEEEVFLTLSPAVMYMCFLLPFHVRGMGIGTTWEANYETIDLHGRQVYVTGTHELLDFLMVNGRRVAVIDSRITIPVRGYILSAQLMGNLNGHVRSEIYTDTGDVRYRRSVAEGKVIARVSGGSGNVRVRHLESIIRLIEDGKPAEALIPHPTIYDDEDEEEDAEEVEGWEEGR